MTQIDVHDATVALGAPVSLATISRLDRQMAVRESTILAVREALERQRIEVYGPNRVIAGHQRVHLCVIAPGWEPHYWWEEGRWEEFTRTMSPRVKDGLTLRVLRERAGLTRAAVARGTQMFEQRLRIDHKTVRRVEDGGPCPWLSGEAVARALNVDPRRGFRPPWSGWSIVKDGVTYKIL